MGNCWFSRSLSPPGEQSVETDVIHGAHKSYIDLIYCHFALVKMGIYLETESK